MKQIFGSSLKRPWALIAFGSNAPPGRRPATTVAYLTDDCGDHYLGGAVEFYRRRDTLKAVRNEAGKIIRYDTAVPGDPSPRWHYRHARAKKIPKAEVLHVFATETKGFGGGPSKAAIAEARRSLPVTPGPEAAAGAAVTCPACKGAKVQTIRISGPGTAEQSVQMDCIVCKGAGAIDEAKAAALKAEAEMWCRCGNQSENVTYHPDGERGAAVHKHHWTCDDCGKVTQIG